MHSQPHQQMKVSGQLHAQAALSPAASGQSRYGLLRTNISFSWLDSNTDCLVIRPEI
jgi:hypothetical protein